jgi:hypothetical protein
MHNSAIARVRVIVMNIDRNIVVDIIIDMSNVIHIVIITTIPINFSKEFVVVKDRALATGIHTQT